MKKYRVTGGIEVRASINTVVEAEDACEAQTLAALLTLANGDYHIIENSLDTTEIKNDGR